MNLRTVLTFFRYTKSYTTFKSKGTNLRFGPKGHFARPEEISFGNNIYIGPNFHISARSLTFGNNILIGPEFLLEGEDHVFRIPGNTIWSTRKEKEIGFNEICDDVWIGGRVTVLKNVKIGEGTIVGASSVVTKSLPPYTICVGMPCKPLKPRFTLEQLKKHLRRVNSDLKYKEVLNDWKKHNLI